MDENSEDHDNEEIADKDDDLDVDHDATATEDHEDENDEEHNETENEEDHEEKENEENTDEDDEEDDKVTATDTTTAATVDINVKWLNSRLLEILLPNNTTEQIPLNLTKGGTPCLFTGKINSDPNSLAVVSGCMEETKASTTIMFFTFVANIVTIFTKFILSRELPLSPCLSPLLQL